MSRAGASATTAAELSLPLSLVFVLFLSTERCKLSPFRFARGASFVTVKNDISHRSLGRALSFSPLFLLLLPPPRKREKKNDKTMLADPRPLSCLSSLSI